MKPMKELNLGEAFLNRQRKLALQDVREMRKRLAERDARTASAQAPKQCVSKPAKKKPDPRREAKR